MSPSGYVDRKVLVRGSDGTVGEIPITSPRLFESQEFIWNGSSWSAFNYTGYMQGNELGSFPLIIEEFDDSATGGPNIVLIKTSVSPAANDNLGAFFYSGYNSVGEVTNYASHGGKIIDSTDSSEDGRWTVSTIINGIFGERFNVGQGAYVAGAVDMGVGTVNAAGYYINGVAFAPETAADLLTRIKTVDGVGSGLDADTLDGISSAGFVQTSDYTAADVLTKIKTVDGAGSGLDADLLDGQSSAFYATASGLSDHLADISAAHAASAISCAGGTGLSATDVEAAIDELATEKLDASGISTPIVSGTYTPTLTNVTNVAASAVGVCQYMRVGNVCTVSGRLTIDPTAAAAATELGISLPVASVFSNIIHCAGVASSNAATIDVAGIEADAVNARAAMKWVTNNVANHATDFTFTYRVI